jgi:hypothetical protein
LAWWLQVELLLDCGRHKPQVNQVEMHPLLAQRKLVGVSFRKVRLLCAPALAGATTAASPPAWHAPPAWLTAAGQDVHARRGAPI